MSSGALSVAELLDDAAKCVAFFCESMGVEVIPFRNVTMRYTKRFRVHGVTVLEALRGDRRFVIEPNAKRTGFNVRLNVVSPLQQRMIDLLSVQSYTGEEFKDQFRGQMITGAEYMGALSGLFDKHYIRTIEDKIALCK